MQPKKIHPIPTPLILIILLLYGCNMPSKSDPTKDESGFVGTVAARTVVAQLTIAATSGEQSEQPVNTQAAQGEQQESEEQQNPSPTLMETLIPTETQILPSDTPVPSATATSSPCNQIAFIKDFTITDGTKMVPGENFIKTWRLKNIGTCIWTSGYSLVFDSGDSMGAPLTTQLTTGTVAQDDEYDVSIELIAPDSSGTYRGNFKLRSTDGIIFGLGDDSEPFWVEIEVEVTSGVMLDFIASADIADWGSGTDSVSYALPGEIELTYGSSTADGYVTSHNNIVLENGSKTGVILETHPKMENNGYIIGRYPEYTIGFGDYISAKIGFLAEGDGSCGGGNAIFQIFYTLGTDPATATELGSWNETCDGALKKIYIDIGSLKGETVRFYLIILANGTSTGDSAIWDSIGVMR